MDTFYNWRVVFVFRGNVYKQKGKWHENKLNISTQKKLKGINLSNKFLKVEKYQIWEEEIIKRNALKTKFT